MIGVGETPLNRKGLLVTRNGDDEEIVWTCMKIQDVIN